jgi:hypothetical protein
MSHGHEEDDWNPYYFPLGQPSYHYSRPTFRDVYAQEEHSDGCDGCGDYNSADCNGGDDCGCVCDYHYGESDEQDDHVGDDWHSDGCDGCGDYNGADCNGGDYCGCVCDYHCRESDEQDDAGYVYERESKKRNTTKTHHQDNVPVIAASAAKQFDSMYARLQGSAKLLWQV